MYIEKKIINGKSYFYARANIKYRGKVKSITVAYLGKLGMKKHELKEKLSKIPEQEVERLKKRAKTILASPLDKGVLEDLGIVEKR